MEGWRLQLSKATHAAAAFFRRQHITPLETLSPAGGDQGVDLFSFFIFP